MPDHGPTLEPILAEPVAQAQRPTAGGLVPAGLAITGILFATAWWLMPAVPQAGHAPSRYVPETAADLGAGIVTPIDAADRGAVHAAMGRLNVPSTQREQLEGEVLSGKRRIGWIVVTDSADPDGDTIAIEADGIIQTIVLTKAWMPVPVLLGEMPTIGLTAVKDGDSGGITVALATRSGPLNLRPLIPGEHIQVAAP